MAQHTIKTHETLPAIAALWYGDASRWTELVTANTLRPPYIARDRVAALGQPVATATHGGIAAGGRTIAIDALQGLARPGARLVFRHVLSVGTALADIAIIETVNAATLTLRDAIGSAYPAGGTVALYPAVADLAGRVLVPGDVLIVPMADDSSTADPFGQDIATDTTGRLILTATGDLQIVAGAANLRQQLRQRLLTEPGALLMHPGYGCEASRYVGAPVGSALLVLMQAAVAQALQDDPRVSSVDGVEATQRGETITIEAKAQANTARIIIQADL